MSFAGVGPVPGSGLKSESIAAVIPSYNSANLIRRALDSVQNQIRPVDEIIVIDDGSTDNTEEVVSAYTGVRYIRQKNSGVSAARNAGIDAAQSDWVAFLDADDEWLPEKIDRLSTAATADCGVVYSDYWIDFDGRRSLRRCISSERLWPSIRYRNPFPPSVAMIRRNLLLNLGGFRLLSKTASAEDWELAVRLACITRFVHLPEALTVYYIHGTNSSGDERQFLSDILSVVDSTLLCGLKGLSRWLCRSRLRCTAYTFAAIAARDNGRPGLSYLWRALRAWPWPDHESRKYRLLAHALIAPLKHKA
jgi:glycosyltransferase involved in cell wall biosynthesis